MAGYTLTQHWAQQHRKAAIDERQIGLISQMYKDDSLAASVAEGFHVRDEVYQSISRET